jgi:hypothetical protein
VSAASKRVPESWHCWRCVTVNVDVGTLSGWSIWGLGNYVDSGELDVVADPLGMDAVIQRAQEVAVRLGVPCVLVREKQYLGPIAGKDGRIRGRAGPGHPLWKAAWKRCGAVQKHSVAVSANAWRGRLIGAPQLGRAVIRAREQRLAAQLAGRACGPDESPAVCIGHWASKAGQVGAVLPKKFRGAK